MPRKARIDAPDALHHIIIRGWQNSITDSGTLNSELL